MLIEVRGVQFVNKGAELMLYAVLEQIKQHWPDSRLVLAPNSNSPYEKRAVLGALQRMPLRKGGIDVNRYSRFVPKRLRRWLQSHFGIVFACDIDVVLDASGFAYGDQWTEGNSKFLCAELHHFVRMNKAYILLPQAFGPFSRDSEAARLKLALPEATLICARDESSFDHVQKLIGDVPNLVQFPDFTNLVTGEVPSYFKGGEKKVLIIPNSNMLSTRNNYGHWQTTYIGVLVNAVNLSMELGFKPVLLNHEGEADAQVCRQVAKLSAPKDIEIITELDPLKVKGIIGASKAVICSRFHGCVSALSQGIPCLGTSWSHKYERLFEEYGQLDALLPADTNFEQLQEKLQQVINNANNPVFAAKRKYLEQQSNLMWQQVAAVVRQKLTI
uniref:Polysaccharide pyruvyl transferase domain-containing protein n=1 Tax=Rheinheimera sp. BAL341 TaxID=1708203 RepID=A0A486XXF6_9GAMM